MTGSRQQRWTILEVLNWTRAHFDERRMESARLDAEVILAHVLGVPRVMLYARFDQPMTEEERARVRELVVRRSRGEPVAHLLGRREFWSLDLEVTRHCLVPRPDTERLVEVGLEAVKSLDRDDVTILDLGVGSGCIALALASELPAARVFGTEISADALAVAHRNAERLGLGDRVTFWQGDLLAPVPADAGPFHLVVANLPYIPSPEIPTLMVDVRDYEPHVALDGGPDGLDIVRRAVTEMGPRLAPGAHAAFEAGPDQMDTLEGILTRGGFVETRTHFDPDGLGRVAEGTWPR